ncbi:hypothetical protein ACFV3F_18200 [Streptomyces sp. NPDC059717]|uniref:hypothetical protein n=1 Tax=Streptomyces sp. NPDC059717 TaxID=3346922 RepID=UPI00369C9D7D
MAPTFTVPRSVSCAACMAAWAAFRVARASGKQRGARPGEPDLLRRALEQRAAELALQ